MDRLEDLRRTLPKNIQDNANYRHAQFLLLDYNSQDGLGDWVRSEMGSYLDSGRLVYYRTEQPQYFCPNHSRNVSFRLAKGLVVNVDADNYMHPGFLYQINRCAVTDRGLLIVSEEFLPLDAKSVKLKGRFAMYQQDIEWLKGFDEQLDQGYGFDDLNFLFRAMMARFKLVCFDRSFNANRIHTPRENRIQRMNTSGFREGHIANVQITARKLFRKQLVVNDSWGCAILSRNFTERVELQ